MFTVRVTDKTFGTYDHGLKCCPHAGSGNNVLGAKKVFSENLPVVRFSDITIHSCPHCPVGMCIGKISSVFSEGLPHHTLLQDINEFCGSGIQITSGKKCVDTWDM